MVLNLVTTVFGTSIKGRYYNEAARTASVVPPDIAATIADHNLCVGSISYILNSFKSDKAIGELKLRLKT